jgi:hypothetical protein
MKIFCQFVALTLLCTLSVRSENREEKGRELAQFLEGVSIRHVPFHKDSEVSFVEAVSYVVSKAIELDTSRDKERKGIGRFVEDDTKHIKDCVVFPDGLGKVVIICTEREISLRKLVVEIARQSKLDLYSSSVGLVFCHPNKEPSKEYPEKNPVVWSALYQVDSKSSKPK